MAAPFPAVVRVWRHASQSGNLLPVELSQFGKLRQERHPSGLADAGGAQEDVELGLPLVVAFQELGDAILDRPNFPTDGLGGMPEGLQDEFVLGRVGAIFFGHQERDQLPPADDQRFKFPLFFRGFFAGSRCHQAGKLGQDRGIQAIRFRELAEPLGRSRELGAG